VVALLKTYLRMNKQYLAVETISCKGSEFVKTFKYIWLTSYQQCLCNDLFSCFASKSHRGVKNLLIGCLQAILLLQRCLIVLIMNCKFIYDRVKSTIDRLSNHLQ
jgi:hypothetical protein